MRRRLTGRRPILALGTIAGVSLSLAGCAGDPPAEAMFTSVDQCVQAGWDQQVCSATFQDAMQTHLTEAPRFDGLAACEAEYGEGQCSQQQASGGGSGFFIPFMAGYMMSTAFNNLNDYEARRRNGYTPAPIYRTRDGQTMTPVIRTGGTAAPTRQTMQPVNVNTTTVTRQGFGGRSFGFGG